MGAETFYNASYGVNPQHAFKKARESVLQHGYTGTILRKDSFVVIECPRGMDPEEYADKLISEQDRRVSRYGAAGCIMVKKPNKIVVKEQKIDAKQESYYAVYADNILVGRYKLKSEATHAAKEYSLNNLVKTEIYKESGKPVCKIDVEYTKDDLGKYIFFGWASC